MRPSWQMRRISVSKSPTFTGQVRDVFHQDTPAQGRRLAARLIESLPRCPIPEIARLGRTLRKWKDALDAYFDTDGASNGPTEAINGHYRTGQTHRQRLPQPHQLQTPNAPHRRRPRRLHPHSTLKSRFDGSRNQHADLHARTEGPDRTPHTGEERSNAEPGTSWPTSIIPTPQAVLPKQSTDASNTYTDPHSDLRNLTNYIARCLLETGGFRPQPHPQL